MWHANVHAHGKTIIRGRNFRSKYKHLLNILTMKERRPRTPQMVKHFTVPVSIHIKDVQHLKGKTPLSDAKAITKQMGGTNTLTKK